jgi:hypothetical protein
MAAAIPLMNFAGKVFCLRQFVAILTLQNQRGPAIFFIPGFSAKLDEEG